MNDGGNNAEFDKEKAENLAQEADRKEEQHAQATGETPLPKVTFSTFVMSLASSALAFLGEVPDPYSGQVNEDLSMAKHLIDTMAMLREKTGGCLNEDERRLLDGLLYEARMKYVMKAG
jgi:hypothetical protein